MVTIASCLGAKPSDLRDHEVGASCVGNRSQFFGRRDAIVCKRGGESEESLLEESERKSWVSAAGGEGGGAISLSMVTARERRDLLISLPRFNSILIIYF